MNAEDRERFNKILDDMAGASETSQVLTALAGFGLGFFVATLAFVACYQLGVLT